MAENVYYFAFSFPYKLDCILFRGLDAKSDQHDRGMCFRAKFEGKHACLSLVFTILSY